MGEEELWDNGVERTHIPLKPCIKCGERSYTGFSYEGICRITCHCGCKTERKYNPDDEFRLDSLDTLKGEWNDK